MTIENFVDGLEALTIACHKHGGFQSGIAVGYCDDCRLRVEHALQLLQQLRVAQTEVDRLSALVPFPPVKQGSQAGHHGPVKQGTDD